MTGCGGLRRFSSVSLSQGRASGLDRQAAIRKHKARNASDCGRRRALADSGRVPVLSTQFGHLRRLEADPAIPT
jgi:hypothetical protein